MTFWVFFEKLWRKLLLWGDNCQIWTLIRELILHWANQIKIFAQGPSVSEFLIKLEERSIQFDKCFLDDWHMFIFTKLDIHHCNQWISAWKPLLRLFFQISHAAHHSSLSCLDDSTCIESQWVAIIAVKVCWKSASAFITEVIGQWLEISFKWWIRFELSLDQIDQEFLCLDFGYLDISMRVSFEEKLLPDWFRHEVEDIFWIFT